jgi:large-conductance mechanosensitive channel
MEKDKKYLFFELLEYLSPYGIGVEANIKDLCGKYAIKSIQTENLDDAFEIFSNKWSSVMAVLSSLEKMGYIKYSTEHGDLQQLYIVGGNFSVSITKDGLDYYYAHALRKTTLKSLKNQFIYNLITWVIAIVSIAFSIFVAVKNNNLSNRVTQLEKEKQQLKSPPHLKVAYGKKQNTH